MQHKKRNLTLFLLLLLISTFTTWYFFDRNKKVSKDKFLVQGTTTINGNAAIQLWDHSAVDGDTINFYFDGKLIYENLGLQDTPTVFQTGHLSKGEHWMGIKAVSEGFNPPATPHISITDGTNNFEFDIDSWKDSASGSWLIKVE